METNDSFLSFACCLFSITLFPLVNTNVLNNVVNPLGWIFANLETIQWDWLCGWTSLRQWTTGCLTDLSLWIMNLVVWLIMNNLPCVSCLELESQMVTYILSMANNRQVLCLRVSKLNRLKFLKLKPNQTTKPLSWTFKKFKPLNYCIVKTTVSWFNFGFQLRSKLKFIIYNISLF